MVGETELPTETTEPIEELLFLRGLRSLLTSLRFRTLLSGFAEGRLELIEFPLAFCGTSLFGFSKAKEKVFCDCRTFSAIFKVVARGIREELVIAAVLIDPFESEIFLVEELLVDPELLIDLYWFDTAGDDFEFC